MSVARTEPAAASRLLLLPPELQLRIAELVNDDHADRAALCLAVPPLGLAAIASLPAYQHPLLSVGLRLFGAVAALLDERLMRHYAARSDATAEGCAWLTQAAGKAGSEWGVRVASSAPAGESPAWRLLRGGAEGALLRAKRFDGGSVHFEGEKGAERKVREVLPGPGPGGGF